MVAEGSAERAGSNDNKADVDTDISVPDSTAVFAEEFPWKDRTLAPWELSFLCMYKAQVFQHLLEFLLLLAKS